MPDFNGPRVRAAVSQHFAMGGVAIVLAIRNEDDSYRVLRFQEGTAYVQRWEEVPPMAAIENPTFSIQEDFARALYEELGRFFQGQPDLTTARADLLHERTRRDKLEDAMIYIAKEGFHIDPS
jgi:hypothetical protein